MKDNKGRRGDYLSEEVHESKERTMEIIERDRRVDKNQKRLV